LCTPHGVEINERKELQENKKEISRERKNREKIQKDERELPLYYLFYVALARILQRRAREREREEERKTAERRKEKCPGY
jgi:hypothetical protein